jgi:hypothetical protein
LAQSNPAIRQWWISNAADSLPDVLIRKIRQSAVLPEKSLDGEDVMTTLLKTDNELDNELCEKACRLGGHATQAEAIHNA